MEETENNQRNPFWVAFDAIQKINARNPRKDQPEELNSMITVVEKMNMQTQRRLVFFCAKKVLEGDSKIQGLFAVAKMSKMIAIAYNTSAIKKAIEVEGLSFDDLIQSGLVKIKKNNTGRPSTIYFFGKDSLENASKKLRTNGHIEAAKVLEDHLRRGERVKALAEAEAILE